MLRKSANILLIASLLLLALTAASSCSTLTAGLVSTGQLNPDVPELCYTLRKPPSTKELLMVDTAAFDPREGYYICTNVTGGASGFGCSTQLRKQDKSICVPGIDGTFTHSIAL